MTRMPLAGKLEGFRILRLLCSLHLQNVSRVFSRCTALLESSGFEVRYGHAVCLRSWNGRCVDVEKSKAGTL